MKKETVLITGGNGMIGCEIVKRLVNKYNVVVIDQNFKNIENLSEKISFIKCDINDNETLKKHLNNVKCVIHLAALVHWKPKTKNEIDKYIGTNTKAAEKLFRACSSSGVGKVLFFSTSDVYADSYQIIDETAGLLPKGIYGISKFQAEKAAIDVWKETGLPICIFRPASVFGKCDRGSMKSLISLCRKGILPVIGNGSNIKALAYVKDIAIAVENYVESVNPFGGEVFNIGSGNFTYIDTTNAIEKVYGIKPIKIYIPKWVVFNVFAKIPKLSKLAIAGSSKPLSFNKLHEKLGYIPSYNLEKALLDCKDYYITNRR